MAALALTKQLYFTTTTVIDWLDVFTRPIYKHIVIESLAYSYLTSSATSRNSQTRKYWQLLKITNRKAVNTGCSTVVGLPVITTRG